MAAETLDKIKQCLAAAHISVEVENIKVKPLRAGSKLTLQDIFVVATLLSNAYKMLRLVCNDRGQPAKAQTGCGSLFSLIKRNRPGAQMAWFNSHKKKGKKPRPGARVYFHHCRSTPQVAVLDLAPAKLPTWRILDLVRSR